MALTVSDKHTAETVFRRLCSQRRSAVWERHVAATLNAAAAAERGRRSSPVASKPDQRRASPGSRAHSQERRRRSSVVPYPSTEPDPIDGAFEIGPQPRGTIGGMIETVSVDDDSDLDDDDDQEALPSDGATVGLGDGGGGAFVLVAKEHLVGIWLAIFVRATLLADISDVRTGRALVEACRSNPSRCVSSSELARTFVCSRLGDGWG